jgi:hypothetical protein
MKQREDKSMTPRDEVLAMAEQAGFHVEGNSVIVGYNKVVINDWLERFHALAVAPYKEDAESEQRWATHYAQKMHALEVALRNLEQAYSNRHSPQHRMNCLIEARSLLNPVDRARSAK